MRNIKLGIAPIGWSNDDMPELGGDISFQQCISEMALAGFQGCEIGHKFPRDPDLLYAALAPKQLAVASGWHSLHFTEADRHDETIASFTTHMNFLQAMGANVIVVCECGHSIQGQPLALNTHKPEFSETQWQQLFSGLQELGKLAQSKQMTIVYHHHMGTGIQNQKEIARLMQNTDPNLVSLLLDTGHMHFAGNDILATIHNYKNRIKHVHLKDIRAAVLDTVIAQQMSFLAAVRAGVFTVPGDGCIDFKSIFQALDEIQYQGWWIVEAEQDPALANPLVYAKMARDYLAKTALL